MGGSSADIESADLLGPEQRNTLNAILQGIGLSIEHFPSELFPGFPDFSPLAPRPEAFASLAGLERLALGAEAGRADARETTSAGRQAIQGFLNAPTRPGEEFENFFREAVEAPATRAFSERVLPAISRTNSANFFGKERVTQDQEAREDLINALIGERSRLAFGTSEAAKDRALKAASLIPGLEAAEAAGTAGVADLFRMLGASSEMVRLAQAAPLLAAIELINQRLGIGGDLSSRPTMETVVTPGEEGLGGDLIAALGTAGAGFLSSEAGAAALVGLFGCWVADELYGECSHKATIARFYVAGKDTRFLRAYKKHGERWARWVRRWKWVNPLRLIAHIIWGRMVKNGMLEILANPILREVVSGSSRTAA